MKEHSELAWCWPAIVCFIGMLLVIPWPVTGGALVAAAFGPCCWVRDYWVDR